MFIISKVKDTIKIKPRDFGRPIHDAVHSEIDIKYPNRVLLDVGLVICRHGDCLRIGLGSCVPGEGHPHHECVFKLIVFRPFIDEVIVGSIVKSTEEGIQVSLGFFQDIYIPAYWMLNPTTYEKETGLWVWTPTDENEEEEEEGEEKEEEAADENGENGKKVAVKQEPDDNNKDEERAEKTDQKDEGEEEEEGEGDENRFEMEIGAEIRFKVKAINYTPASNSFKSGAGTSGSSSSSNQRQAPPPPPMVIIGSICEDGLGLTGWWDNEEEEEEEEEEGGEETAEGNDNEEYFEEQDAFMEQY